MDTPPTFFYSPNAYALGIIERRPVTCQCCGLACEYCYTGTLYCLDDVEEICPWCIANGRATTKYDGSFVSDFEGLNPGPAGLGPAMSAESMEQVSSHTPGYASWQGSWWLGHCGEACVFLGYVGSTELAPVWAEVRADAIASGWGEDAIQFHMHKEGDMTGYLFQCPRCGQHRLHVDTN